MIWGKKKKRRKKLSLIFRSYTYSDDIFCDRSVICHHHRHELLIRQAENSRRFLLYFDFNFYFYFVCSYLFMLVIVFILSFCYLGQAQKIWLFFFCMGDRNLSCLKKIWFYILTLLLMIEIPIKKGLAI